MRSSERVHRVAKSTNEFRRSNPQRIGRLREAARSGAKRRCNARGRDQAYPVRASTSASACHRCASVRTICVQTLDVPSSRRRAAVVVVVATTRSSCASATTLWRHDVDGRRSVGLLRWPTLLPFRFPVDDALLLQRRRRRRRGLGDSKRRESQLISATADDNEGDRECRRRKKVLARGTTRRDPRSEFFPTHTHTHTAQRDRRSCVAPARLKKKKNVCVARSVTTVEAASPRCSISRVTRDFRAPRAHRSHVSVAARRRRWWPVASRATKADDDGGPLATRLEAQPRRPASEAAHGRSSLWEAPASEAALRASACRLLLSITTVTAPPPPSPQISDTPMDRVRRVYYATTGMCATCVWTTANTNTSRAAAVAAPSSQEMWRQGKRAPSTIFRSARGVAHGTAFSTCVTAAADRHGAPSRRERRTRLEHFCVDATRVADIVGILAAESPQLRELCLYARPPPAHLFGASAPAASNDW